MTSMFTVNADLKLSNTCFRPILDFIERRNCKAQMEESKEADMLSVTNPISTSYLNQSINQSISGFMSTAGGSRLIYTNEIHMG